MNPKQKRTWGTILRAFGLMLLAVDIGLIMFHWKPAAGFAIGVILIAGLVPLWFGTILIWQAKKEDGSR
jgi:divalent metal cation (Fe/Co/Zn/Cd) transporter